MADTVRSSNELKITWEYEDGDTSKQTIKNPLNNLDSSTLTTFATQTVNNKTIISPKNLKDVKGIKAAVVTEKTDFYIDLK